MKKFLKNNYIIIILRKLVLINYLHIVEIIHAHIKINIRVTKKISVCSVHYHTTTQHNKIHCGF